MGHLLDAILGTEDQRNTPHACKGYNCVDNSADKCIGTAKQPGNQVKEEQTHHPLGYLEQLYTFADRGRDGDGARVISIARTEKEEELPEDELPVTEESAE